MDRVQQIPFDATAAAGSVCTVGEGRGFVIEGNRGRYIITAAHCLPSLPPPVSFSHTEERTFPKLVGPLGSNPMVWAECLFVDPIADVAVLGAPDNQQFPTQSDEYEKLVDGMPVCSVGEAPRKTRGWLFSLEGHWFSCSLQHVGGPLWASDALDGIRGGMSGSPILMDDGKAVGIVVSGGGVEAEDDDDAPTEGGPEPWLVGNLPGWLLREITSS